MLSPHATALICEWQNCRTLRVSLPCILTGYAKGATCNGLWIMLSKAQPRREAADSAAGVISKPSAVQPGRQTSSRPISLLQGFKQQTAKWPLQPMQAAAAYLAKHSQEGGGGRLWVRGR